MDGEDELEERLSSVGIADTAAWPIDATIVPRELSETSASETLPPVEVAQTQRSLPHLSVDLGATSPGRASRPSVHAGADLEVRGVIGEGGMGRVFLARQHSLQRDVAVKTAKDGAGEAVRRGILIEGAITGQLEHPAIVPVHALGVDTEGRPAMVMKRIEGETWHELARNPAHEGWEGWEGDADERLPGHLQILLQICNALHFAHSRGIVHRDIKLENVLIGRFGDVYLADWGIAAPLGERCERLAGTPGYMAPEMVDRGVADERTDVYLLGATLHEILTGDVRHGGRTAMDAIRLAKLSEPHDYDETVPVELGELVNSACHQDKSERPVDAKAFRDAVLAHVRHRESAALGAEGAERVDRLEALLEDGAPDEEQRREIDRVMAEARFGLETALTQWPDNVAATRARARLEVIQQSRREHAAALEREAWERDPRVASRVRALGLSALALLSVSLAGVSFLGATTLSREKLVFYPSLWLALTVVGVFVMRKRVLGTKFNRQLVFGLSVLMSLIIAGRLMGYLYPIETSEHLMRDSLILAAGLAIMGVAYLRWIGIVSVVFLANGVLCAVFPEQSTRIFSVATAVAVLIAVGYQWRAR